MTTLLEVRNLSFSYREREILRGVDFCVRPGDTVALVGANGIGKTTLLKICAGLLTPKSGDVLYRGRPLLRFKRRDLAKMIALVPQEVHVSFDFSVEQFVELGRTPHLPSLFASLQAQDRRAIEEALHFANVAHLRNRGFNQLSGGERQLVKIALAVAQQPSLLLLDEPTQHLDIGRQAEVFAVLKRLNQAGVTIVASMHDLEAAFNCFTSAILIRPDSSVDYGPTAAVLSLRAIQDAFGVSLPPSSVTDFSSTVD